MGNVIVKMPTGKIFLVEVYDKDEFSVLYRKIEDLLILNDEIMGGCLEPEEAEKIVVEFFNFVDVVYLGINYCSIKIGARCVTGRLTALFWRNH